MARSVARSHHLVLLVGDRDDGDHPAVVAEEAHLTRALPQTLPVPSAGRVWFDSDIW